MFVRDVVELVLPPLPLLEDWFSNTAVSGTSSTGSPLALVAIAGTASKSAKAVAAAKYLPTARDKMVLQSRRDETTKVIATGRTFKTSCDDANHGQIRRSDDP